MKESAPQYEKQLSPQEQLARRLTGAQSLSESTGMLGRFLEFKSDFVKELREKYPKEIVEGSESYHLLTGSGTNAEAFNTPILDPDPLYEEIEAFVRETLGRL